jgi:hypothetical protein
MPRQVRQLCLALLLSVAAPPVVAAPEPNAELAATWWPPQRHVWTPVGWKDHLFRFNVLYNGTVLCYPNPGFMGIKPYMQQWVGQNLQIDFIPSGKDALPELPKEVRLLRHLDGGHGNQGWVLGHETPVLWTEWATQDGLILRKEMFARVPGGDAVQTGIEPLYGWMRLSVAYVDPFKAPERFKLFVRLTAVHTRHQATYQHDDGIVLETVPKLAPYPKELSAAPTGAANWLDLVESDGKVRLTIQPAASTDITLIEHPAGSRVYYLRLDFPVRVETLADLVVPMISGDAAAMREETALGWESALAESDRFWSVRPASAARLVTPEEQFNRVVEYSVKFADILAEKNYQTGEYTWVSGSWGYPALWSTPTSMVGHMFLDLLGYYETVKRHAKIFRLEQGATPPPGKAYGQHPGYYSTPRSVKSVDWLADHGAILHLVAYHALVSGDEAFAAEWTDSIVKACEFIADGCALTNHAGVKGLLPPAVATDDEIATQAVWNLAWNYKGLTTAVRLLRRMNHPRTGEFDALARRFKKTFLAAYRDAATQTPRWTNSAGRTHPLSPTTLTSDLDFAHPFYLDTGPLVLVWAGLMDAGDPLMRSAAKFFREGPNHRLQGYRNNALDRPVLIREISSCEPCYSWNLWHSWQLGDRAKFLEGMYSLLTGALSPQTYISCEHRHGMYGNLFATPMMFAAARLAVIDDAIKENELHLLRLCPLAWVSREQETRFENMPTEFGPVSLRWRLSKDGKALQVNYEPGFRHKPAKVVLHVPPVTGLNSVNLNTKKHSVRPGDEIGISRH